MDEQVSDQSRGDEHRHFGTLEGLRHLVESQEEGRVKLGEHMTRISRMLVMVSEAFERLEVAAQEANRIREAAAAVRGAEYNERLAGLKSQLDVIHQDLGRLTELREQADVHHTSLFALLLNGQHQLRTDIAEIKHWVMSRALRPPVAERLDALPTAAEPPQAPHHQVRTPDAG